MINILKILSLCLFFGISIRGNAQKHLKLTNYSDELKALGLDSSYYLKDSLLLYSILDSIRSSLNRRGYLAHSIENIDPSNFEVIIKPGYQYQHAKINVLSQDQELLNQLDINLDDLINKPVTGQNLEQVSDKIITYLENNGYPFASVQLKNVQIQEDEISGDLDIYRNKYIVYDTINYSGEVILNMGYLNQYLDIDIDEPYDKSTILKIKDRFKNLGFMDLKQDPTINFVNQKAVLNLVSKKKKSSRFDFLIGLQQNQGDNGQEYTITGEFTAELLNKLGYGEMIFAEFKRLRPETQELELKFQYPYVLNMPFGIDTRFKLFRNSTEFLELSLQAGLQYQLSGQDYLKAFWNYDSSRLLDVDSTTILNSRRLPQNLDVSFNGLGISAHTNRLDYRFNPRKGYYLTTQGAIGFKTVSPNVTVQELKNEFVDFSNSYDSLDLRTYQYDLRLDAGYYIPLLSNVVIKSQVRSAYKWSAASIFSNELYRIGGNGIMRGFDEQSIRAQFYSIMTFELRFLLAQQASNFTLSLPFVDYGFVYNELSENGNWDQPIGVGIGMNFETAAGLFNFAIAAGKQLNNPFDFNKLKIHFGYESLF